MYLGYSHIVAMYLSSLQYIILIGIFLLLHTYTITSFGYDLQTLMIT